MTRSEVRVLSAPPLCVMPQLVTPDLEAGTAYTAREVIATALPEALSLRNLYYAVKSGDLAPVYDLLRPENDYYLEQISALNVKMDAVVRNAGGLTICHEVETEDPQGESDVEVRLSRIRGSYFQSAR